MERRLHLHHHTPNSHLSHMQHVRWDLVQMFTPPKSKSPWEAATSGSTGGWASFAGPSTPTNPNDPKGWGWMGPALTAAAGAFGGPFGPLISAGMGAMGSMNDKYSGFQGTDKGWSNLWTTPLGGLAGYGMGTLGAGVGGAAKTAFQGGLKGLGGRLASGFGAGVNQFTGTNIIPGWKGSNPQAWFGGANAIPTKSGNITQPLYGGQPAQTGSQYASQAVRFSGGQFLPGAAAGVASNLATGAGEGANVAASAAPAGAGAGTGGTAFSSMKDLIGAGLATGAGAMSLMSKPPTYDYKTAPERLADVQGVLRKYMGDAAGKLPQAASEEYLRQIKAPLGELYPEQVDAQWGRLAPQIEKSWDQYEKALDTQFAQAGGIGSTDYNQAKAEARRLRVAEMSQSFKEIQQSIFNTQVAVKQDALRNAAAQGNFDMTTAMELAKLGGQDQELMMAIQSQNYQKFQQVLGQIMYQGYSLTQPSLTMPNSVGGIKLNIGG